MAVPDVYLFTTGEAAAALGVDVKTIVRWVKNGRMKAAKRITIGRGVYIFTGDEIARVAALPKLRRGPKPVPPQGDELPLEDAS